ncbi:cysteine dioxygenase [Paenibacillus sp. J31TS4]|uniref:cysteine dioxygenase n=1 Tax=Paenibacillus sp. J31TS4 TaxID=2807195 RepID=UPI001B2A00C2|nr:cysteine dioxygenase family protein [Paenibacillus sp. J31TS4]GIP36963.1 cysteine dioxygenase [Paenibacillus sp. J31TS4]
MFKQAVPFKQAVEQAFEGMRTPTLYELKNRLASLACTSASIEPYVTEPEALPYGRNTLYVSDEVEVVVIHLPPGAETPIHDHADSIGCAQVIRGTIANQLYRVGRYGFAHERGTVDCPAGEYLFAGKGQVHALANREDTPAVSLHVYSPPLAETRRYKPVPPLDYVI